MKENPTTHQNSASHTCTIPPPGGHEVPAPGACIASSSDDTSIIGARECFNLSESAQALLGSSCYDVFVSSPSLKFVWFHQCGCLLFFCAVIPPWCSVPGPRQDVHEQSNLSVSNCISCPTISRSPLHLQLQWWLL